MKIEIKEKKFGDKVIFRNRIFDVKDGKINFVKGPSGSGKTTLFRMIAGLDSDFDGKNPYQNAKISYVFQEPRLFPNISVYEQLKMIDGQGNIEKILDMMELEKEKKSFPEKLSGGMKMRLSIARAIYHNGDVILLDEPFSALDENTKNRIIERTFSHFDGKTVIVISHNEKEIEKYAQNVIEL